LDTTSGDMYAIIPLNSSVPFNIGTQIVLANTSTNIATVSATSGVTLISKNDKFKLNFRGSVASLFKTETNEWILGGDLTASSYVYRTYRYYSSSGSEINIICILDNAELYWCYVK
jgi:hypothetical protein